VQLCARPPVVAVVTVSIFAASPLAARASPERPVAGPAGAVGQPASTPEVRARAHFEAGQGLYHLGKYEQAIREFSEGYQAMPKPEFLINLGQCYRALGQPRAAREYFARFLTETAPEHPARAAVTDLLAQLDQLPPQSQAPPPSTAEPTSDARPRIAVAEAPKRKAPARRRVLWGVLGASVALVAGVALGVGLALSPAVRGSPSLGTVYVGR
jgi:tetratricopeptide (TPR) repeat protein